MKTRSASPIFSTVSRHFVEDWIEALRGLCSHEELCSLLERSEIPVGQVQLNARITLDQVVCLYQLAAVETGDEMMGLWERPIRPRALQHLLTSVREAKSLPSALYRFTTFWNLLLDDFQFEISQAQQELKLTLRAQSDAPAQRFGHMLILKLAHGLMSWMAGREVPVKKVGFAFDRPEFDQDYSVIFPAHVVFDEPATFIALDVDALGPVQIRNNADLVQFLQNAPRDWLFTHSSEHTRSIRVRSYLMENGWDNAQLKETAKAMNMTPRTLIRRLNAEGTSFQEIKDGLRRDMAIRDLQAGQKSIEAIAQTVGFSSAANFHRAFLRWTGGTPSSYRRN